MLHDLIGFEHDAPIHEHDCTNCTFLGNYENKDLYHCDQNGNPTVISRFGSDGDYSSGMMFADVRVDLAEAKARAEALGLPTKETAELTKALEE